MPSLPDGWGLKTRPRKDGKVDIVGKDVSGSEYVARTTEGPGVTERDLQILKVGNREQSSAREFVKFYENERDSYKKAQDAAFLDDCFAGAERVVHAGLHLNESKVGYSRSYARGWERAFGQEN